MLRSGGLRGRELEGGQGIAAGTGGALVTGQTQDSVGPQGSPLWRRFSGVPVGRAATGRKVGGRVWAGGAGRVDSS